MPCRPRCSPGDGHITHTVYQRRSNPNPNWRGSVVTTPNQTVLTVREKSKLADVQCRRFRFAPHVIQEHMQV